MVNPYGPQHVARYKLAQLEKRLKTAPNAKGVWLKTLSTPALIQVEYRRFPSQICHKSA